MATLELNPIPGATDAKVVAPNVAPAPGATIVDVVRRAIEGGKPDIAILTGIYLKLRNTKKDLETQAKAKIAPLNEGMDMIEACFLSKMLELGVDSLKNERGTPYKSEQVSITVADNSAFVGFVLDRALAGLPVSEAAREVIKKAIFESGQLALIEARASKSAVEAFLEETQELPPGLNRRAEAKVNVRTAA